MKKEFELSLPIMPNFINIISGEISKKEDGFVGHKQICVSSLTEKEAEEYGEDMKQEFIKHWKRKRAAYISSDIKETK